LNGCCMYDRFERLFKYCPTKDGLNIAMMPKRIFFLIIVFLCCLNSSFAQEKGPEVSLKDGQIQVILSDSSIKTLDYSKDNKYSDLNLKKWIVYEKADPVKEAIKVYKNKAETSRVREVWIVDRDGKIKSVVLEYEYNEGKDKLVFSSDEDFVYYFGLSDHGGNVIYGVNLLDGKEFLVASNAVEFDVTTCPDDKSYVIVQVEGEVLNYYVYTLNGNNLDAATYSGTLAAFSKDVCD